MSNYKRFFSYIYAYEDGIKKKNTGFAKLESQNDTTCMELHLQNLSLSSSAVSLYVFVRKEERIKGIYLCDIPIQNASINWRISFSTNKIGESSYSLSDLSGIVMKDGNRISFVSQWDEGDIHWESFFTEEEPKSTSEDNDSADSPADADLTIANLASSAASPTIFVHHNRILETGTESFSDIWEDFLTRFEAVRPFSDADVSALKIELKELKEFPKSNWHLFSNSFLLRGFFTYRYLLFWNTEIDGQIKWQIGIPGYFSNEEHVIATLFGFHDFIEGKNNSSAKHPFGYWYRAMDEEC